ncbi:hypothetical protein BH09BAC5_BH09BAC5_29300 [soil metagenome]
MSKLNVKYVMRKIILFLLLLPTINAFCQFNGTQPIDENRVFDNNYFYYDFELAKLPAGATKLIFDTLDYCRIQRCKIKSATIYHFSSASDSVECRRVEYDSSGFTEHTKKYFNESDVKNINCDSAYFKTNAPNKVTRRIFPDSKEIWVTDNLGYIIEYKKINRGFTNRLFARANGGGDNKFYYTYDSLHLSVTQKQYCSSVRFIWRHRQSVVGYDRFVYKIDKNGNLLSEFSYIKNGKGELVIQDGFTFHYEYY